MARRDRTVLPGWPRAWTGLLDDAALERASSTAIFGRGRGYADAGCVQLLAEDRAPEPALRARVTGSQVYTTDLWIERDALVGDCDCPHAQDGWFCKHQVAAALVWRERLQRTGSGSRDAPGASPFHRTAKGERVALREFLRGQESAVLADRLLMLAERDDDIARELQQWRQVDQMKDDLAGIEPMLEELLSPGRGFIDWQETASYARRARAVLPLLAQARARRPATAVPLCVRALERLWDVVENADDSSGEIGGVCEAIGAELAQAAVDAGALPASFGDVYLRLQLGDPFGSLDAVAIEAAMGTAALARYRSALAGRWRRAKVAMRGVRANRSGTTGDAQGDARFGGGRASLELSMLESLHLAQLERMGDHAQMLEVLRADTSTARSHSRIVSFLESAGRFGDALAQAQAGHEAFPDDWTLQEDLLRCYDREGRVFEALSLRRSRFESRPGVDSYHLVMRAGKNAGADASKLRAALLDVLQRREHSESGRASPLPADQGRPQRGLALPDVSLRAEILASERRWIEAAQLMLEQPVDCRHDIVRNIAVHLPARRREQAVDLLLQAFDAVMPRSATPYREALALVGEIAPRMDADRRSDWLTHLRVRYKLKRNFIAGLPR